MSIRFDAPVWLNGRSVKEALLSWDWGSGSGHVDVVALSYRWADSRWGCRWRSWGFGDHLCIRGTMGWMACKSMLNPLSDIITLIIFMISQNLLNTSAPPHFHAFRPAHGSF